MSQQQEAPFVMCVVVLYCTPSGVLFTIIFFPQKKNHKICNRPNFCLLFVLMIDLKMKNVKDRTESVVLNYICNLEFV